jgi:prepilin-type N-terminal cleavage/methylation domain-containing protein
MNIIKMSKRAFTLVELLIVITIIAILSSISFKAISIVNQRSAIAQTTRRLMNLSSCIAEYHAEYGQYPPAELTTLTNWFGGDKPDGWEDFVEAAQQDEGQEDFGKNATDNLLYYLLFELDSDVWASSSDEVGLHKVEIILAGHAGGIGDEEFTIELTELKDAWWRDVIYKCEKPYTSYILYSQGPKSSIAADDIYANETY